MSESKLEDENQFNENPKILMSPALKTETRKKARYNKLLSTNNVKET